MHLKLPIFHSWDLVVKQFKSTAPRSMQSISQNANEHWAFMDSENAFTQSAKQGLPIALAFAFVVLLIASRNIIIALSVISSIAIALISVLYVIVTRDWPLELPRAFVWLLFWDFRLIIPFIWQTSSFIRNIDTENTKWSKLTKTSGSASSAERSRHLELEHSCMAPN